MGRQVELSKADVDAVRRLAARHSMRIAKSRDRSIHHNNCGGLQLVCGHTNTVLEGVDFNLDRKQAEYWIDRYAKEKPGFYGAP